MERAKAPTRSACDKCHDVKTKCNREMGSVECKRCLRLWLTCSYSAPLRMGRPKGSRVQQKQGERERRIQQQEQKQQQQQPVEAELEPVAPGSCGGGGQRKSVGGSGPVRTPMDLALGVNASHKALEAQDFWTPGTASGDFDTHSQDVAAVSTRAKSGYSRGFQHDPFQHCQGGHDVDMEANSNFHIQPSDNTSNHIDPLMSNSFTSTSHGNNTQAQAELDNFYTQAHDDMPMDLFSTEYLAGDHSGTLGGPRPTPEVIDTAGFRRIPAGRHTAASSISDTQRNTPTSTTRNPDIQHRLHEALPDTAQDEYEHAMYRLSILQLDLYRFRATMPSAADDRGGTSCQGKPHGLRADDIFSATGALIEIVGQLFPPRRLPEPLSRTGRELFSGEENFDGKEHDNVGGDASMSYRIKNQEYSPNPHKRPDVATILSVLSCYLRLLDIYGILLANSQQFLNYTPTTTPSNSSSRGHHSPNSHSNSESQSLPILNVGSFSLLGLHDLNISVQLHMISQMLKRVQNMVSACVVELAPELDDTHTDPLASASVSPQTADGGRWSRQGSTPGQSQGSGSGTSSSMTTAAEVALREIRSKEWVLWELLRTIGDSLRY